MTVTALQGWVSTGLALGAGDQVTVTASGSWYSGGGGGWVGPDGSSTLSADNFLNLTDIGSCGSCAHTVAPYWSGLIGYVGSSPPPFGSYTSSSVLTDAENVFFVGSSRQITASRSGTLWLGFNDDAYSGNNGDNQGEVSATVVPSSAPAVEPTPPGAESIDKPVLTGSSRDPVITSIGSYTYTHADIAIPGRGPAIAFVRAYNSLDTRVSPMGPGWTHSYNAHLADSGDGSGNLVLVGPRAGSDLYAKNPDGSYTTPPGAEATLVKNQDSTYTVTHKDLTVWSFNAYGWLTSIADRYGNRSDLTYSTSGQLTAVSDPAGRGSGSLTLTYDPTSGRLTGVSDWASPARSVQYQYDTNGRLWKVTDRENNTTTFGYDGTSSRLTAITDANNHTVVTMTYDGQGRVATQKDAMGLTTGQQTTFDYVVNGDGTRVTTVTYPATSYEPSWHPQVIDSYDSNGRLVNRTSKPASNSADNVVEQRAYDANSNLTATIDGRGSETHLCYDVDYAGAAISGSRGNLTRRIDPAPAAGQNRPVTLFAYDAKNNLTQTVAPRGVPSGTTVTCSTNLSAINTNYATDSAYDESGAQLLATTRHYTDPDLGLQAATTRFEYNDAANPGLVTRIIPPRGNTGGSPDYSYATTMAYYGPGSQAGMLQSTTDPLGNVTTYAYDSVGRRTSMVDPNGNASGGVPADHTWSYQYDNEDRVRFTRAPAPVSGGSQIVTEYRYDPVGNRTVVIDANGQVTKYAYDARDSLAEVHQSTSPWSDPDATPSPDMVTAYQYDNSGNLSRVVRASGDSDNERATDYAYDGLGRVRKETQYPSWPDTAPTLVTQYSYDLASNRHTLVDPLGQTTTYGYDNLSRLTGVSYSDGQTPNVVYGYDLDGNRTSMSDGTGSTTYSYDEMDHLTSVTSPGPKTVGYRYDADGNRTKVIYPDNTAVTYTFDKGSKLSSLSDWAGRQVGYQYFPDGSIKQVANFNGTAASYSYDNALRLTQVHNQSGTGTISKHSYTLDAVGNRTQADEVLPRLGSLGMMVAAQPHTAQPAPALPTPTPTPTSTRTSTATSAPLLWQKGDGKTADKYWADLAGYRLGALQASDDHAVLRITRDDNGGWLRMVLPGNVRAEKASGSTVSAELSVPAKTTVAWTISADRLEQEIGLPQRPANDRVVMLTEFSGLALGTADGQGDAASADPRLIVSSPRILDASGRVGTAVMRLESGLAVVELDGAFLASASYPVRVQLGIGLSTPVAAPRLPASSVTAQPGVATAEGVTAAWGWGSNRNNELAADTTITCTVSEVPCSPVPLAVQGLSEATSLVSGGFHSLAPQDSGDLMTWGGNWEGQLGEGNTDWITRPVTRAIPGGVRAMAGGRTHSLVLGGDGTVWAWGSNGFGHLGDGTTTQRTSPVQVPGFTGVSALAAGDYHSLALKADGTVWAWGANWSGQLGIGGTDEQHVPVQVKGPGGVGYLTGVVAIAARGDHSLALKADGTVWAWGDNYGGALGDGTTTNRDIPVQVKGVGGSGWLTGVAKIGAGLHHSLAIGQDGTALSWGSNEQGQLGDGTTTGRPSPVRVGGLEGMGVVSAGAYFSLAGPGGNTTTVYSYDRLYRLTSASGASSASYGYDPAGNRSTKGSTAYSYDRADRITAAGATSYTVNANGNLTARGTDSFTYDQANRLKAASVSGTSSSYVYDGDGKRASKTVASTQTNYTYDVNASLPVLLDDGTRKYVWGLGLAFAVDTGGNPIVYHTDGLGSVRALTDASGSVVQTYQYDEYGNVVSSSGSVTQPFQYTGEVRDSETGFIYLRARAYDPASGRFIGRDAFGGVPGLPASLHRYGYVLNNPATLIDPSGMCSTGQSIPVALGAVAAGEMAFPEAGGLIAACAGAPFVCGAVVVVGGIIVIGNVAGPAETHDTFYAQREKGMLDQIARKRGLDEDQRQELGRAVEEWKRERGIPNSDKLPRRVIEDIADEKGLDNR